MIDQSRGTVADSIHQHHQGGGAHVFRSEGFVQRPPEFLEDLRKIFRGRPWDCHPACEGAIEMCMGANISWHDVLPASIQALHRGMASNDFCFGAHVGNQAVFDENRLILQDLVWLTPGDQIGVCNQHIRLRRIGF